MDDDEMKPMKASTPTSPSSKEIRSHLGEDFKDDDDPSVMLSKHINGDGDFTFGSGYTPEGPPPPNSKLSLRALSKEKNPSSFQRVRASLSKTQTSIVELFSRDKLKDKSSMKLNKNRKKSDLDTIVASSSSASGDPQLLSAQKKTSTSMMIRAPDSDHHHNRQYQMSPRGKPDVTKNCSKSANNEGANHFNNNPPNSFGQSGNASNRSSVRLPCKCGANFVAQIEDVESPSVHFEDEKQLVEENRQLWKDNQTLAAALEDVQPKLEYLQKRNKYLEVACYQEGRVLTDIIKKCHEEIAKLRGTQCELLSGNGDEHEDFDKKIREYYISKYSNMEDDYLQTI